MHKTAYFCHQDNQEKEARGVVSFEDKIDMISLFCHSTNRLSAHSNTMGAPSRYLISSTYLPPLENAPSNILCSLLRNQQQRLATRLRKTSSKRTSSFLDVFLSARVPTHQLKGGATT